VRVCVCGVCVCACVCVCVYEEEEIFAKEFGTELSALFAANYQNEGHDRVFQKCSYMSKHISKKCRCVNRGEIVLFQRPCEQNILKK